MNGGAVSKFIEYIEAMAMCGEQDYVRDSRGCYLKNVYIRNIISEAKELIKYGEAEIALENILENLSEVSIFIDRDAAILVQQAFGEKFSSKIENILNSLIG